MSLEDSQELTFEEKKGDFVEGRTLSLICDSPDQLLGVLDQLKVKPGVAQYQSHNGRENIITKNTSNPNIITEDHTAVRGGKKTYHIYRKEDDN
ncbi:MAG: hypothetical protein PHP08_05065 [Candidatus Dojkabacteria bacterium]|nr:hypothetical protein [Candidatus Dojkabacteria bacterium]